MPSLNADGRSEAHFARPASRLPQAARCSPHGSAVVKAISTCPWLPDQNSRPLLLVSATSLSQPSLAGSLVAFSGDYNSALSALPSPAAFFCPWMLPRFPSLPYREVWSPFSVTAFPLLPPCQAPLLFSACVLYVAFPAFPCGKSGRPLQWLHFRSCRPSLPHRPLLLGGS